MKFFDQVLKFFSNFINYSAYKCEKYGLKIFKKNFPALAAMPSEISARKI